MHDFSVWALGADLCQLVQRHSWEIGEVLNEGLVVYGRQCVEQAWDHDADWLDELADAAHRARAGMILRVCGAPEALHERILDFMDLFPPEPAKDG